MIKELHRYHVYYEDRETDSDNCGIENAFGNWYDVDDVQEVLKDICNGESKDIIYKLSIVFGMPELLQNCKDDLNANNINILHNFYDEVIEQTHIFYCGNCNNKNEVTITKNFESTLLHCKYCNYIIDIE